MQNVSRDISVITLHEATGKVIHPIPIKFEITEDGEKKAYKITAHKLIEEREHNKNCTKYRYNCRFVDGELLRECEILFNRQSMKWMLSRI